MKKDTNDIYKDRVGLTIKKLNKLIMRNECEIISRKTDIPPYQGWIIGFLYHHRDQEICQKDIEEKFSIAKSTVTGIVKQLEQNGYIERKSMDRDNRLKCLTLTESGIRLHETLEESFVKVEEIITNGLSADEIETFIAVSKKLMDNLSD